MSDVFRHLDDDARQRLKRADPPDWVEPMLATLEHDPFSDDVWIYERKFDGERVLAFVRDGSCRLLSRNRNPLEDTYPELVDAIARLCPDEIVVDGEVVAFEGDVTSFSRLQGRMQITDPDEARASGIAVYYYLFDIVHLDGRDVTAVPLRARKSLLKSAVQFEDPVRFSPHRNADGEAFLREACEKGWEGLIAKKATSAYRHGRSRDWRKFKCTASQELVIGGFTAPQGSRLGFGALLVGYYEGDELRYAGKVGTGFDDETLVRLRERLDSLEQDHSPFADAVDEKEGEVTWTTPELVGAIAFTEWTEDGRLRHPRFQGLRRDKPPREVTREAEDRR